MDVGEEHEVKRKKPAGRISHGQVVSRVRC